MAQGEKELWRLRWEYLRRSEQSCAATVKWQMILILFPMTIYYGHIYAQTIGYSPIYTQRILMIGGKATEDML